jgi:hypothetical protein
MMPLISSVVNYMYMFLLARLHIIKCKAWPAFSKLVEVFDAIVRYDVTIVQL